MEIVKTRSARGHGRWGHANYAVELISTSQTWTDQGGTQHAMVTSYELSCSPPAGSRYFASAEDRDEFIADSFTSLDLRPVDPPEGWTEPQSLTCLVGQILASVEFVAGRFTLVWDADQLTVSSNAALVEGSSRLAQPDDRFAERLTALVGHTLRNVDEVLGRGLVLTFDPETDLEISLSEAPEGVVDAAEHSSKDCWSRGAVWAIGEAPFERTG